MPAASIHGRLLLAGSATVVAVMALHPTGRDLMQGADARNVAIHSIAIAGIALVFLGLLGVARRLGGELSIAAIALFGLGAICGTAAAVCSGFVAAGVAAGLRAAEPDATAQALLAYTGLLNQGFARVHVAATSLAIVLFSIAFLRRGARGLGWLGLAAAGLALAALCVPIGGHVHLDVHRFGLIVLAQSIWTAALGWSDRAPT